MAKCCSCNCTEWSFGVGAFLAILLSWSVNHSILWAIVAACFDWLYVIYWWIEYGSNHIH